MLILGPVIDLLARTLGPAGIFTTGTSNADRERSVLAKMRRKPKKGILGAVASALHEAEQQENEMKDRLEELEAVRQALAELSEELQVELKEIVTALLGAQWEGLDHSGIADSSQPRAAYGGYGSKEQLPNTVREMLQQKGIGFDKFRKAAMASMESSHRKQLASVEKVVRGQMELLESIVVRQNKM